MIAKIRHLITGRTITSATPLDEGWPPVAPTHGPWATHAARCRCNVCA